MEACVEKKKGISGSTIKMIAIITMLIDHVGAAILEKLMLQRAALEPGVGTVVTVNMGDPGMSLTVAYYITRCIGRVAFPLFIFLLVEGLEHTRNQWKYLMRMAIFAIVSEIPFDMAFNLCREQIFAGQLFEIHHQNVFFTLTIGLLTIIGLKKMGESKLPPFPAMVLRFGIPITGMALAWVLQTDYGAVGVLAIVVMYLFRKKKVLASAMTCLSLLLSSAMELTAFIAVWPVTKYNGSRGWKLKWLFYLFYPAHLLILWLICLGMGIA